MIIASLATSKRKERKKPCHHRPIANGYLRNHAPDFKQSLRTFAFSRFLFLSPFAKSVSR
jgi:hypothetical protein